MTAPIDPVDKVEAGLLQREPTLAAWLAATVAAVAGTWAFAHLGTNADTVEQILEPVILGGVLTGFGFVNRSVVVPVATFAKKVEAEVQKRLPGA